MSVATTTSSKGTGSKDKAARRGITLTRPKGGQRGAQGAKHFVDMFRAPAFDRIDSIRAGYPADDAKTLFSGLAIEQSAILNALDLKTSTFNRKATQHQRLSRDESERVIGFISLLGQVQAMVEESGDPDGFDAAAWLSEWLIKPVPALGGVKPLSLLDTMEGQALLSDTLAMAQSGAYA